MGKSLLFIGYSLSDINIRYLLFRLQRQWELEPERSLRPRSYVFLTRPNPVHAEVLQSRGVQALVADSVDASAALAEFLRDLRLAADAQPAVAGKKSKEK